MLLVKRGIAQYECAVTATDERVEIQFSISTTSKKTTKHFTMGEYLKVN